MSRLSPIRCHDFLSPIRCRDFGLDAKNQRRNSIIVSSSGHGTSPTTWSERGVNTAVNISEFQFQGQIAALSIYPDPG